MAILVLQSGDMRVEVDPAFGARVLSLVDRRSGRDWMAKGPQSTQTGEDALYRAAEAVGWDECFPTVSPWDARDTPLARRLRDHGDLWGRPWSVDAHTASSASMSWSDATARFSRHLSIEGATLTAGYEVANIGHADLPFMWALHGLFAVTPDDGIEIEGVRSVAATHVARDGRTIAASEVAWPLPGAAIGLPLDRVHLASTRFAAKLYASDIPGARASVGGRNGWLDIAWDAHAINHLGIWLNYGGWPQPGDVHHVALEPTTAPVDHLGQAIARQSAIVLGPGATSRWRVTMHLRPPASHEPAGSKQ